MRYVTALAMLAVAAGAARADEVVLRNGARFEGQVVEGKDSVTVVMDFGTMTFKKVDVRRIDRGPSAMSEFDAKAAELKSDDLDGKYKLAMWARQKQLDQRAKGLFEEILARDPEHAGAREALGYRRHEGRWMTEDEINLLNGLVYFRGGWMRREVADEIRRLEVERDNELSRIAALQAARLKEIEAETDAQRRLQDADRYNDDYYYYPRAVVIYGGWGFNRINCQPKRSCRPPGDAACKPAPTCKPAPAPSGRVARRN